MSQREHEEGQRAKAKIPWERPTLTGLGHVRDLVKGATKVSGNSDSDGTSVRKPPVPG